MRTSLEWIADFVDLPPVAELCERLVAAGIEVEGVTDPSAAVRDVVVAEVQGLRAHPQAERLQICDVFDGQQTHQIVCGAANVASGMRVALARLGGYVPGPAGANKAIAIAQASIRGIDSFGMLCARSELGLEEKSDGLWALPPSYTLGAQVMAEAAVAVVLDLGITPNRPDLMCHLGIAREVAASTQRRTKTSKWRLTEKGPDVGTLGRLIVEETAHCKRYMGRVVRGLKVGPSPTWLKERLEAIGQRSINNVVDATNYVMHELGQPLHAFDLSRLAVESGCPTLRVRRAQNGEILRTLDGVERKLCADDLIIADPNRPVALAGVMGGADSEVREATSSVLIESAFFAPAAVRQLAKRHGLRTESSQRFERGVDPGMMGKALDRCAQILADFAEGEVAKGTLEVSQKLDLGRELPLRLERINKLLGISMPTETVVQLLEPLEIRCVNRTDAALIFHIPSFRADITREVDLIEEVARRHGYERIPERMPDTAGIYRHVARAPRPVEQIRSSMLAAGCNEAITYAFGKAVDFAAFAPREGEPLMLLNPLGEDMRAMRTTLVPGLMQVMQHNMRHGIKEARFFEVGTSFHRRDTQVTSAPPPNACPQPTPQASDTPQGLGPRRQVDLPREDMRVACVIAGERHQGRWYGGGDTVDATDITGIVEAVIDSFDVVQLVERVNCAVIGYNPFCSAQLRAGDTCIGHFGQLDPDLAAHWNVGQPVFAMELSLTALSQLPKRRVRAHALPRFPKTRRDLAVICSVERGVSAAALQRYIAAQAGGDLGPEAIERVWLFDRYTGAPLKEDEVSLAFGIDYRSRARTLQESEVATAFAALQTALQAKFGLQIRSA